MQTYHTLVGYNKGRLYIKNHCKTIFGDRVLRRHFWYVSIRHLAGLNFPYNKTGFIPGSDSQKKSLRSFF